MIMSVNNETSYSTQIDAARKGIVTPQMKDVLSKEVILEEILLKKIIEGKIVIPANKNHKNLKGIGIGEGLKTKVNVNIGVSEDCYSIESELKKAELALSLNADSIMDLSTYGDTSVFRRKLVNFSDVMIGTVPMYDAVAKYGKDIKKMTKDDLFNVVKEHIKDGIDFLTIHAGLTRTAIPRIKNTERLTNIVSRGGSILYEWMILNDKENPFYEDFDRLLDLCSEYDVTLSLGDGLRPGSIYDSTDAPQIQELIILGELTKKAWQRNIQVMIEGPGHVPINEINTNVQIQKKLCHGAPFYVLGPIVTDIAPGYDHITSSIGGALAAACGADFLCFVTPAEHLRLPTLEDIKEGLIAAKISAHAGDIGKGIPEAKNWDNKMSKARGTLDWDEMLKICVDPVKAQEYRKSSVPKNNESCSMCGDLCPVKRIRELKNSHPL